MLSVEEARKKALAVLDQRADEIDPQEEKKRKKASATTLDEVLDDYLSKKQLRKTSIDNLRQIRND